MSSSQVGAAAEPSLERELAPHRAPPSGTPAPPSGVGLAYVSLLALSVGSVLLIGAGRVRDQSYWGDEAVTAAIVRRPLGGLVRVLWSQEAGMGPYYAALWVWGRAFGGDAGLRMFSVVGMAVVVAFAFDLTWRWFGGAEAVAVSAVLIAHPFALRYLVELRAYSWMMALGVGLVWVVDRWWQNPTSAWTVCVGVVAGLLAAIHIAAILFVVAIAIAVVTTVKKDIWFNRRSLVIAAITAAAFASSVPALLARKGQIDWIAAVSPSNLVEVVEKFSGRVVAIFLGTGLLLFDGCQPSLAVAGCGAPRRNDPDPVLVALLSVVQSLWIPRYLAPAFALAVIAAVAGCSGIWRRIAARWPGAQCTSGLVSATIATVALGTLVVAGPFRDDSPNRDGMRSAVAYVTGQLQPGDLVLASDQEHMPLYHYLGLREDVVPSFLIVPDGNRLYPVEADVNDIADRLRAAPRIFVVRNAGRSIDRDIIATFDGWDQETHRFGRVSVETFERVS